ncbi:LPXTG cell wall anchor domain-containing protein [Actinomyces trachealis]|uniref:LPXTG cell wall anchor domain-containing protein n=1 Tax=Actinomyces trachealis TaxID=2763540 RepID=UPI00189293D1
MVPPPAATANPAVKAAPAPRTGNHLPNTGGSTTTGLATACVLLLTGVAVGLAARRRRV